MNRSEVPHEQERHNLRLERIIHALSDKSDFPLLRQDTRDIEQLKPIDRLRSIQNVWVTQSESFRRVKTAIDAGSGFGYGVIFLDTVGIKAIGVENVRHKITQGIALFTEAGVSLREVTTVDFSRAPALLFSDFVSLPADTPKVDLVTLFYLSGEMVANSAVIEKCRTLLTEGGKLLMSTEAPVDQVLERLQQQPIPSASVIVNEVKNNFEKTVITVTWQ